MAYLSQTDNYIPKIPAIRNADRKCAQEKVEETNDGSIIFR